MKLLNNGNNITLALSMEYIITLWGTANDWIEPMKVLENNIYGFGNAIEFIAPDILLSAGSEGIKILYYMDTSQDFLSPIPKLHSGTISDLLPLFKNIIVTASSDSSLKVLDPIDRKCYFTYQKDNKSTLRALAKFI